MKIRNGVQEQNQPIYQGDLGGEAISIALVENDPSAATRWVIKVWVQLAQGQYFLGAFTTNTALVDGAASRIVGFASCPGATGWMVQALNAFPTSNMSFDGELFIQPGKCCGGGGPYGVTTPPQPPGSGGGENGGGTGGGFTPPTPGV